MSRHLLLLTVLCVINMPFALADLQSASEARARGDYAAAATEYRRLAESGDPVAQVNLGYMYYLGEGLEQDYGQAIAWYNEAASQGNADAQYNLAVAYAFGEGVDQDFASAVKWYQAAANQGHAVAQYSLGLSYSNGEGVGRDPALAMEWFSRSAEQGYVPAQLLLATRYYIGEGAPLDYALAAKWFRTAADQGNAIAQYNLAGMYRNGQGVEQDIEQARNWYRKAAELGYTDAVTELSALDAAGIDATTAQATDETLPPAYPAPDNTETVPSGLPETAGIEDPLPVPDEPSSIESAPVAATPEPDRTETTTPEMTVTETDSVTDMRPADQPDTSDDTTTAELIGLDDMPVSEPPPVAPPTASSPAAGVTDTVIERVDTASAAVLPSGIDNNIIENESAGAISALAVSDDMPSAAGANDNPEPVPAVESVVTNAVVTGPDSPPEQVQPAPAQAYQPPAVSTSELVRRQLAGINLAAANPARPAASEPAATARIETPVTEPGPRISTVSEPDLLSMESIDPALPDSSASSTIERLTGTTALASTPVAASESVDSSTASSIQEDPFTDSANIAPVTAPDEATGNPIDTPRPVAERTLMPAAPDSSALDYQYEDGMNELKNRNYGIAYKHFNSAAEAGHAPSQYQLGLLYQQGLGTDQDQEAAAQWHTRAAEQGHADASFSVGNMYLLGEGLLQDDSQARYWYEQAAAQGHTGAMHNLQNLARLNPVSLEQTADETPQSAQRVDTDVAEPTPPEPMVEQIDVPSVPAAADSSAAPTQTIGPESALPAESAAPATPTGTNARQDYERGLAYAAGTELPKDLKSAFTYFKRAAEANHPAAQYKLGVAYAYGEGTAADPVQSAHWYEKAALQGHPIAIRNLGLILLSEDERVRNRPLALAWLSILADRGNEMDIRRADALRNELSPVELEEADRLKQQLLEKMPIRTGTPAQAMP